MSSYILSSADISATLRSQVKASNSDGAAIAQSAQTAVVTASTDTTPPTEPGDATVSSVGPIAATLAWRASADNLGVIGYQMRLNAMLVATTSSLSYTFTGLSCGATYTLAVTAYDAAGNLSPTSFSRLVTSACTALFSVSSDITQGQPLDGSVRWSATTSGSSTTSVDFVVDGAIRWTATTAAYTFGGAGGYLDTSTLTDGAHTLALTAHASSGATATQSSTVLVSNPTPATPDTALPAVGIAAGASLQNWSPTDLDRQLADDLNMHVRWIRHDFVWDAIEPEPDHYTWSGFDQFVSHARSRGLNIIATISYTPAWANGGHSDHDYQPTSADQFGRFAGQVAARYAAEGVHAYEIWNEPNINFWKPLPDPAAYTRVLCSAYRTIHSADPQATVITGGTSPAGDGPSTYSPQTWLTLLYENGARPCFDAIAHHPYLDSSSTPGDLGNAWYLMADYARRNLRAIMTANGDSAKRIWATEVGCNRALLGDTECSNRLQEALQLWHGYSWAGALGWFVYWDPNVYGLVDANWLPRPEWYAYQSAATNYH
jgi:hypothetical protein